MSEYYIGQVFDGVYPPDAAVWCNQNNAKIIINSDGKYEIVAIPEHIPSHDEITELRRQYRRNNIDDKTAERTRRTANGTWTADDEQEYLALDAEVTAWIEANLPYND